MWVIVCLSCKWLIKHPILLRIGCFIFYVNSICSVSYTHLKGDIVIVQAGEQIPADGEIIEGAASVDESAITGESAPVIRESGGDRSAVTGGTTVLSDWIVVQVTLSLIHIFLFFVSS